ncbi:hypothetical protein [Candidatus Tisiphia endosymbiont of Hybos culiciformis]|uniref:hypothetical protein n=1 Tax=Candidatus Tisiphia endosymbiont of Hybos culiciformis TaxID=3139331 RepID=UPI003CCAFEE5
MLKKYYLVLFLLIYSSNSYASFWNGVAECLNNPCNCGYGEINETWNNEVKRTIKPNPLCPPWNRRDGRDADNCLIQFDPPENWIGFYLQHCAEHTTESSYFAPKIRIRTQSCNAFACWNQSTSLNWDGECVIWPGAYALPLLRICARIAVPAVEPTSLNSKGTPADPGYTPGKHLNDVGFPEDDTSPIGEDGKPIKFDRPKLCAYSDPGLVNLVSATGVHLDPLDWNPVRQPLHKTDELHPLTKVLVFLIDIKTSLTMSALLGKLLDMLGAENTAGLDVIKQMVKWVGYILEQQWMYDIAKEILKTIGTLNRSVDDYEFGCVELPFGPFPPPYCPKLAPLIITPTTKSVCSKKKEGKKKNELFVQSSDAPCVVSKLRNNLIHNVVRVSLDNLIPLCKNKENPQKTDKCVVINNLGPFASAKGIHIATVQRDAIKKCPVGNTEPCVNTKIDFKCSVTENGCEDGFRIVYAQKIGEHSKPSDYYVDDLPDCNSREANGKTTCQEIWGINIGEFIDVKIEFPKVQSQDGNNLLSLKKSFELKDNNGNNRPFVVSIAKDAFLDTTLDPDFRRDPQSICVTEGDQLVGCEKRVTDGYQILTQECGVDPEVICPNNSYYTPQFVASIQVLDTEGEKVDLTSTVVTPLLVNSNYKQKIEEIINLAGYNFTSFMAYISNTPPAIYTAIPFSGKNSMNPSTIYGEYKNDKEPNKKAPYDTEGKPITDAIYLKGLEYINGKYIQGATHGCLQLKDIEKCIPGVNNTNCVLAKLLESDTIDCLNFKEQSTQYQNLLPLCKSITNCNSIKTIEGITIYKCNTIHCYTNDRNPGVEVCKVSVDFNNRSYPSPLQGDKINTGQHYDPASKEKEVPKYDPKIYAIRDKTSQELGFCTPIKVPKCEAISTPTDINGNATWRSDNPSDPRTEIGHLALGTCKPGWVVIDPNKPLQRYCLSNIDSKTIAFEVLPNGVGCKEGTALSSKYTSDFKDSFPVKNSYDPLTKTGTSVLGGPHGSVADLTDTLHWANYEFDIPNTNILNSFTIGGTGSYYDDYLMIKVNDKLIYTGPPNHEFKDIKCRDYKADNCVVYISKTGKEEDFVKAPDIYRATRLSTPINLMPYLRNGKNNIKIYVGVVGGGILNLTIKYQLK